MQAGKHVYQEKTMAFNVDQPKRMRAAYLKTGGKLTVQVGHQSCSSGHMPDAKAFLESGNVGKITAVHMHMYRNTPHGKPQWSRPVYPDMTPTSILWDFVPGEAAKHPSMRIVISTGASIGIIRAVTCMRTCVTSFRSGTRRLN